MTTQQESAAWLAANRPDLVNQPSNTPQQAEQINSDYLNNRLPVLPQIAPNQQGISSSFTYPQSQSERALMYSQPGNPLTLQYVNGQPTYLTPDEYQQKNGYSDAQYEQMKYNVFNNPSAISNPDALPEDLKASYNNELLQNTHEYYRQNPSPEFQRITALYKEQHQRTLSYGDGGSSVFYNQGSFESYDPSGDVGITGNAAKQWGESSFDSTPTPKSIRQSQYPTSSGNYIPIMRERNPFLGFSGEENAASIAWDVEKSGGAVGSMLGGKSAVLGFNPSLIWDNESSIMPEQSTVATRDPAEAGYMPTIELPFYEGKTFGVAYGNKTQQEIDNAKMLYDSTGGGFGLYQVPTSSDSTFVRRFGMVTSSGSSGSLQSGMFSVGGFLTPDVRSQGNPDAYSVNADISKATEIRANPEKYSRMGAEAYGGTVQLLDDRKLNPLTTPMGRYPEGTHNLANLVDPFGVNQSKDKFAEMPWKINIEGSSDIASIDTSGKVTPLDAAGYAKIGDYSPYISSLPTPFISTSSPKDTGQTPTKSDGWVGGVRSLLPSTSLFSEASAWIGGALPLVKGASGYAEFSANIAKNSALDYGADKSFSGAIAHTQAHETGFLSPERIIYGNADTNELISTSTGGQGYVSNVMPDSANGKRVAVAHSHPEPLPFMNTLNMYSPVASRDDVSGASYSKKAGVVQESVITNNGVLTYVPGWGGDEDVQSYKGSSPKGVLGLGNKSQSEFFDKTGTQYNISQNYAPIAASNAPVAVKQYSGAFDMSKPVVSPDAFKPYDPATAPVFGMKNDEFVYRLGKANSAVSGFMAETFSFIPGMDKGLEIREKGNVTVTKSPVNSTSVTEFGQPIITSKVSGGNETINMLGSWIDTNRQKLDLYNQTAVEDFNGVVETHNAMSIQNPVITEKMTTTPQTTTTTTSQGVTTTTEPDKVYKYGEWSKMSAGLGNWFGGALGINKKEFSDAEPVIMNLPGGSGATARIGYGATKFLTDSPLSAVPAAVQGGWLVASMDAGGAAFGATALGAEGTVGAKIASGASKYLLPAGFAGFGAWQLSEGGTASPQKMQMNVGSSFFPSLAFIGGGGVANAKIQQIKTAEAPVPNFFDLQQVASGNMLKTGRTGVDITEMSSGGIFSTTPKNNIRSNLPGDSPIYSPKRGTWSNEDATMAWGGSAHTRPGEMFQDYTDTTSLASGGLIKGVTPQRVVAEPTPFDVSYLAGDAFRYTFKNAPVEVNPVVRPISVEPTVTARPMETPKIDFSSSLKVRNIPTAEPKPTTFTGMFTDVFGGGVRPSTTTHADVMAYTKPFADVSARPLDVSAYAPVASKANTRPDVMAYTNPLAMTKTDVVSKSISNPSVMSLSMPTPSAKAKSGASELAFFSSVAPPVAFVGAKSQSTFMSSITSTWSSKTKPDTNTRSKANTDYLSSTFARETTGVSSGSSSSNTSGGSSIARSYFATTPWKPPAVPFGGLWSPGGGPSSPAGGSRGRFAWRNEIGIGSSLIGMFEPVRSRPSPSRKPSPPRRKRRR